MTKTDSVVWTKWLSNPGDGQCPIPEFAVKAQPRYVNGVDGGFVLPETSKALSWVKHGVGLDIQEYRYAIPENLAWMAANVEAWPVSDEMWLSKAWFCGDRSVGVYSKDDWLRARQDLGYAKSSYEKWCTEMTLPKWNPFSEKNPKKRSVDQCRLEMLNSLYTAILKAGGDPRSIIDMDMTLESMIAGLAQNGVRFYYDKQGKPE